MIVDRSVAGFLAARSRRSSPGSTCTIPPSRSIGRGRSGWSLPGIMAYADGERFGRLPLTLEAVPGAVTCWSLPPSESPDTSAEAADLTRASRVR